MWSTADDEEAQKRGVVGCAYLVGRGIGFDLQLTRRRANLRNALPVRFDSVHICYNDTLARPVLALAMTIMGTHDRMRFRAHYGSDEECQSQLRSFGIPISTFPVSPEGEHTLENHRTFMAMQRATQATKSKGKRPQHVAENAEQKKNPTPRQPIIKDNVFVAAPNPAPRQPDLDEPTGYEAMSFSNLGSWLPQPSSANPWRSVVGAVVEAATFPPVAPPPSHLPAVSQSHMIGPTSASRHPSAKLCESPNTSYVIYDPLPNDILLGRGKPTQNRPGNVRYRDLLDKYVGKYNKGENGTKVFVSANIVRIVKEEGGRFLKELEDGGWVEVDEATARAKVSDAFRARRRAFQATLKKA